MFYKFLKKDREFNNTRWPFLIKVKDVDGKLMIDATFKQAQPRTRTIAILTAQRSRPNGRNFISMTRRSWFASTLTRPKSTNPGEDDVSLINGQTSRYPDPHEQRTP